MLGQRLLFTDLPYSAPGRLTSETAGKEPDFYSLTNTNAARRVRDEWNTLLTLFAINTFVYFSMKPRPVWPRSPTNICPSVAKLVKALAF